MDLGKLDVYARGKTRDFRLLGSGVSRTKRPISWKFAYMYDGDKNVWMLRETGVTIGVPTFWQYFYRAYQGRILNGKGDEWSLPVDQRKADGIGSHTYFGRRYKMDWLFA